MKHIWVCVFWYVYFTEIFSMNPVRVPALNAYKCYLFTKTNKSNCQCLWVAKMLICNFGRYRVALYLFLLSSNFAMLWQFKLNYSTKKLYKLKIMNTVQLKIMKTTDTATLGLPGDNWFLVTSFYGNLLRWRRLGVEKTFLYCSSGRVKNMSFGIGNIKAE